MQIKIRAWDKDSETMIYGVGITPESDGDIPYQIPVNAHDFDQFDYYPNSIIMLYTGFKDKNGKEIYADDIIRYEYLEDSCWGKAGVYTGHIRFDKGGFEIVHHGDRIIRYPDGSWYEPSKCDDMKSFMSWAHNVEVIGNRYTHPHLLGGEEE
ncbi:YopX family protein [Geobacillus phage vB_GthS_PK3.5]|nr:YopX family protein [Geobacillus phage vB_GthS_PK3.5]